MRAYVYVRNNEYRIERHLATIRYIPVSALNGFGIYIEKYP